MAVTENQLIHYEDGNKGAIGVAAGQVIYIGTMVFVDASGFGTAVTGGGSNAFAGISLDHADNTNGANGDIDVNMWERRSAILQGAGFTAADRGAAVYASDNFTVTTTAAGNTRIGTITRVHTAEKVLVALDVQA